MKPTKRRAEGRRQLVRQALSYAVIGLCSASLDTLVFWALTTLAGVTPHIANVAGISIGMTVSFTLNRVFTFSVLDRTVTRFATFVAVGITGMGISAVIMELGIRLELPLMTVKLLSVVVVALVQFLANRSITFRASDQGEANSA